MDWANMSWEERQAALAKAIGCDKCCIQQTKDGSVTYSSYDKENDKSHIYQRSYTVTDNVITLADAVEVEAKTDYQPVVQGAQFSLEAAEFSGDDTVTYTGKVFECGDYPDKGFSLTEDEAASVVASFAPVSNDLEHKTTVLAGKLGGLDKIWQKGKELYGSISVPKWLHDTVGDSLKTSLAWDRQQKRIIGNALVTKPRIPDAELVAAFTAANTHKEDKKPMSKTLKEWFTGVAQFFTGDNVPVEFSEAPAEPPTTPPAPPAQPMAPESGEPEVKPEVKPDFNSGIQTKLLQTEAAMFADGLIKAGKAFPAERDAIAGQFAQAVRDDNAGVACFSDGGDLKEGDRLKGLKALFDARPAHSLSTEQIASVTDGQAVVFAACATTGGSKPSAERMDQLKGMGRILTPKKEGK